MRDVFDQQHLLISSFVSFLNTAISKQQAGESQVKYNTGLTGWGAPKQPGTPGGVTTKALAPSFEGEKLRGAASKLTRYEKENGCANAQRRKTLLVLSRLALNP